MYKFFERKTWLKMEKKKVDRINELARLSKVRELSEEEKKEQAELRREYLDEVRLQLRGNNNERK